MSYRNARYQKRAFLTVGFPSPEPSPAPVPRGTFVDMEVLIFRSHADSTAERRFSPRVLVSHSNVDFQAQSSSPEQTSTR